MIMKSHNLPVGGVVISAEPKKLGAAGLKFQKAALEVAKQEAVKKKLERKDTVTESKKKAKSSSSGSGKK